MGKVILFQGDSITDCGRSREHDLNKGCGYATMVTAALSAKEPYQYEFYNRGIAANHIVHLYARIRKDIINLKPDYLSILIGVNSAWLECAIKSGVSAEKYEMIYNLIIEELKQELPNLKIMILEPFVLHGTETMDTEEVPNRWEYLRRETALRGAAAKRVAEKHGLVFVPLQEIFNKAEATAPHEGYWLYDGMHPSPAGHELIKNEWLKAFEKMK